MIELLITVALAGGFINGGVGTFMQPSAGQTGSPAPPANTPITTLGGDNITTLGGSNLVTG